MEAASSTTTRVSPAKQHYHPSAAKAWAKVDFAGNVNASYNVASVTDNGTGDETVNLTTSFSSANYGVSTTALTSGNLCFASVRPSGQAAGSLRIGAYSDAGSLVDGAGLYCIMFGDQ